MRERTRRRIDRVREEVHAIHVLSDYGYDVRPEYLDTEQQFSCDLHGDGSDQKPSARVYPDGWWYCFACGTQRDALQTVVDKEGCTLLEPLTLLEERYELPPLPFDPDEDLQTTPEQEIADVGKRSELTFEQEATRLCRYLETVTQEGLLPCKATLSLWEALDQTSWRVREGEWSEAKGKDVVTKLRVRAEQGVQG